MGRVAWIALGLGLAAILTFAVSVGHLFGTMAPAWAAPVNWLSVIFGFCAIGTAVVALIRPRPRPWAIALPGAILGLLPIVFWAWLVWVITHARWI